MVSLVKLHDGVVGVVFVVCLAGVVFAGGVHRPRDVFALPGLRFPGLMTGRRRTNVQ
jgi:hypothetical protein